MVERFSKAVLNFQAGDLAAADTLLSDFLSDRPDDFDGWHLAGVIKGTLHDSAGAVQALGRAVALNPGHPYAQANLAKALTDSGRDLDALPHYEAAVRLVPDFREAWINLGSALSKLKRHQQALEAFDTALALQPTDAEVWTSRGVVLHAMGRRDEAIAAHRRAIAITPDCTAAWYNLALALATEQRHGEALASYDKALATDSKCVPACCDRGVALHDLGRYEEALASYECALVIDGKHALSWSNRGVTLNRLGRFEEALASFDAAIGIQPIEAGVWYNRAVSLGELRRFDEAIASCNRAIDCNPGCSDAIWARGMLHLVKGDLASGWADYESRWNRKDAARPRHQDLPRADTLADIEGRRVLLWAEQGFGDTLQFCRYALLVSARAERTVVEIQPAIKVLLESLPGIETAAQGEPIPPCDCQAPLMSLPLLFGTTLDTVPARIPYLSVGPARTELWRRRLMIDPSKPAVGLACSGSAANSNDWKRSIPLRLFGPIAHIANLMLVQKDLRSSDREDLSRSLNIRYLGDEIGDFADSAAIVENLDLVISVDCALAHLAGALGKPVWILLPWSAEWRWLSDRADTPWYPSARLFRQSRPNEWRDVIDRVAVALAAGI
jgi:tetratricopeptide (TPR) repeat protein